MLPAVYRKVTTGLMALGIALSVAAPAQALGKNERNVLKGIAAAVIVNEVIKQTRRNDDRPSYGYNDGRYDGQRDRYNERHREDRRYRDEGRHDRRQTQRQDPAAGAFYEYDTQSRRLIQQRLAAYGYYRGGIDGVWGRGTSSAIAAYARDIDAARSMGNRDGAVRVYNRLLG